MGALVKIQKDGCFEGVRSSTSVQGPNMLCVTCGDLSARISGSVLLVLVRDASVPLRLVCVRTTLSV